MIQSIQVELKKVPYEELARKYRYAKSRMAQLSEKEHLSMYEKWLLNSFREDWERYAPMVGQAELHKKDFVYMIEDVIIDYPEGDKIVSIIQAKQHLKQIEK